MAHSTWVLDPTHSEVQFKVKHLVISTVTGAFKKFDGRFETDNDDFSNAAIRFTLDVNSIDTGQADRDAHLKNADFFDAENYPQISFQSTSFTKKDNEYSLTGNLTIKDITKPITLKVEHGGTAADFYGNFKAGFDIEGKINRKDFGLTWSAVTEAGSVVVGDEIKLHASVQFARQA
jgi:polyisoprenoid-binding protein YceI